MAANGHVVRGDLLERLPGQVAGEDDVHDVLGGEAAHRRDRVDDRHRPLDRHLGADADLLGELAVEGVDEALAGVDAAARQQPVLLAVLLVPAEEDARLPAQDRRDADPRLGHQWRDEPKPRTPRSLSGSSSTSTGSSSGSGSDDELRDPHPGLDHERLARVGVQQHDPDLAAVALVDQARRVHDRQAVPRREAGARLNEARVAFGDRDREAGADERPLPRSELVPLAGGEVEAGVARVRALGHDRVRVQAADRKLDHALDRASGVGDQERRETSHLAPRQARAHEDALGAVGPLVHRRAERVELRQPRALVVRDQQPHELEALAEALGQRSRSSSSPSPVRAETCTAPGKRFASRRRRSGSSASTLFRTSSTGSSSRRSRRAPSRPRRASRRAPRRSRRHRPRGGRGRRRASPRAWRRSPRPADAAGGG